MTPTSKTRWVVVIGERNHEGSTSKSVATRAGKRRRFDGGKAVGGPIHDGYRLVAETTADRRPVVLRDGRASPRRELDPTRAAVIARIFDLVESGLTFGDLSRQLNAEGLRTQPSKRYAEGARWTKRRVRETVQNTYYAGFVMAYGERRPGTEPALIEPERFERIPAGLRRLHPGTAQRRKGGRRPVEDYILRGVAFRSSYGDAMYRRRYAVGRVYICRNRRESTGVCHAPVYSLKRSRARYWPIWTGSCRVLRRGSRSAPRSVVGARDIRAPRWRIADGARRSGARRGAIPREAPRVPPRRQGWTRGRRA
jgi:hypothetical protein